MTTIKQLVLTNNDEIVCELLDEDETHLIIRNAVKMVEYYNPNGDSGWTFKSFMLFQETSENVILIKQSSVVAAANPIKGLVAQYRVAIEDYKSQLMQEEAWEEMTKYDSASDNVVKFTTH